MQLMKKWGEHRDCSLPAENRETEPTEQHDQQRTQRYSR